MSDFGKTVLSWWGEYLRPKDDNSAARALRARLRRTHTAFEVLSEPAVIALATDVPFLRHHPQELAGLVQVLAEVKTHQSVRLARGLGHDNVQYSPHRFQKMLRAEGMEFVTALRRAMPFVDASCNVAALAQDYLNWSDPDRGEGTRINWCFDYYQKPRPGDETSENQKD